MTHLSRVFIVGLVLSLGMTAQALAPQPDLKRYWGGLSFFGLEWCKEDWTGSDTPFIAVERNIDNRVAQGAKPSALLAAFRRAALSNPRNATSQFAYAYAAQKTADAKTDGQSLDSLLQPPLKALGEVPSPRSYQYTRLRWLLEHKVGQWKGFMPVIGLGKRLIARNPKDKTVRFYLVEELLLSRVPTDQTVELPRYAQEIENEPQKSVATYSLLAGVYHDLLLTTHNPEYADKAISNYQRYLQLTPPSYFPPYRSLVKDYIERCRQLKIRFASKPPR